LETLSVAKNF
jgi:hypothetical protein